MTREEILDLPAGPYLDRLVASCVMEWTFPACKEKLPDVENWYICGDGEEETVAPESGWKPSLDMAAALLVLDNLIGRPIQLLRWSDGSRWEIAFGGNKIVDAPTAPLAICRAALLVQTGQAS